jgi:hypothetical protein
VLADPLIDFFHSARRQPRRKQPKNPGGETCIDVRSFIVLASIETRLHRDL